MRHNNKINALGRKSAHRKAMLSNMAASLILHKRIKTTVAKAKALRVYIEPIITKSKEDTTHSRRLAFGYLQDKKAVAELFREVSPKVHDRPGGYTRILKIGQRVGDSAELCFIELVDFNETMLTAKAAAEAKVTRRGRRGSRKKAEVGAAVKQGTETVSEDKGPGLKEEEASATKVGDGEATIAEESEAAPEMEAEDTQATPAEGEAAPEMEAEDTRVTPAEGEEQPEDESGAETASEPSSELKEPEKNNEEEKTEGEKEAGKNTN